MHVSVEHLDGTAMVRAAGELDLATAPELERVLEGLVGKKRAVVIDLSELTFADCAGLRPVREALRGPDLVRLRNTGAHPQVQRVLELTGLGGTVASPDATAAG
jgi:anti-anti-sigma factor